MSIVEFNGGPITYRSLMNKRKSDLASMYMDLLRSYERQQALQDIYFARGIEAGWNCETAEQRESLTEGLRGPALAELKRLRNESPNARIRCASTESGK